MPQTDENADLKRAALEYHEQPRPGKISVTPTKQLINQRDLALAYSPGVAAASEAIAADRGNASRYTACANLVGVVTNCTAVLSLGNIGPLAAKPVMEGKGVLFKKFAGIDVFDIEIDELDPDRLVDVIAALEPTFGGINLEDIKAPECFCVERKLRERMKIPVFHDDQHGTAIIVAAAILNGLKVGGKELAEVKPVASGAGAAALACRIFSPLALLILRERAPQFEVDGEMRADCALDSALRRAIMPYSTLQGDANLLVLPGIDAANIGYNLLKTVAGNNVAIGPILLGSARPAQILTASATVRRIVNMTALTVLDANSQH